MTTPPIAKKFVKFFPTFFPKNPTNIALAKGALTVIKHAVSKNILASQQIKLFNINRISISKQNN